MNWFVYVYNKKNKIRFTLIGRIYRYYTNIEVSYSDHTLLLFIDSITQIKYKG